MILDEHNDINFFDQTGKSSAQSGLERDGRVAHFHQQT